MATTFSSGIQIQGIASAVPEAIRSFEDDAKAFGEDDAARISKSIGVSARRVTEGKLCTSDLCYVAAERILGDLGWERNSVDVLIFVSQTPDFILPSTSCSLHGRLELSKHCACFDVNLGCSGYVYGLWVLSQLMMAPGLNKGLLLVGDTITRIVCPEDRACAPVFGDAGTATALERVDEEAAIHFELGSDGAGQEHLIVPAGMFRQPHSAKTAEKREREGGNIRSDEHLYMNGAEIFTFSLREVPRLINSILEAAEWETDQVDGFIMHQANEFMLKHLAKRMKLPDEKVLIALRDFGNTSSASIPLALTTCIGDRLSKGNANLILAGFGVGFSWATAALSWGPICMSDLIYVDNDYF